MKSLPRASAGFTLIEMVVTVTVIGVLLAISAPAFQTLILNQGVKTAAFDVFSALEYARSEAIKRPGEEVRLKSGAASDGAWTTGWRLVNGTNILRSWTVASNITVTDKNGTPLTQVRFFRDGHADGTPKLEVKSASTVAGVDARCIKLDLIGRATSNIGGCS